MLHSSGDLYLAGTKLEHGRQQGNRQVNDSFYCGTTTNSSLFWQGTRGLLHYGGGGGGWGVLHYGGVAYSTMGAWPIPLWGRSLLHLGVGLPYAWGVTAAPPPNVEHR